MFPRWLQENPIPDVLTLFTDASGTGMAAYYSAKGLKVEKNVFFSLLRSLSCRLSSWPAMIGKNQWKTEAINVYTDSVYVAGILRTIKTAYIGHSNNEKLFHLLCQLWSILQARHHPYFVGHLCSHPGLPGPLAEGNQNTDALASPSYLLGHVNPCTSGSSVTQLFRVMCSIIKTEKPFVNSSILPEKQA
jgi:hypothetical protein